MSVGVTSRHLRGPTELTILADIKPGLVEIRETMSYATRLGLLLQTLFEIRRRSIEPRMVRKDGKEDIGPLERLQVLHFVHWVILDEGRRLLLTVDYDGPFEPYLRRIADAAGPFLDVILCHCEGYVGSSTDRGDDAYADGSGPGSVESGFVQFARFAREHQVQTSFFYAGAPDLSADDVRYLRALERLQRFEGDSKSFEESVARLKLETLAEKESTPERERISALAAIHRLVRYFPERVGGRRNIDHAFLHRMARAMLPGFDPVKVTGALRALHAPALAWLGPPATPVTPAAAVTGAPAAECIQGGVLTAYAGMTHGCLLLMRLRDPRAGRRFLRALARHHVSRDGDAGDVKVNVAFTYQGLRALGLAEDELARLFPAEFREGMDARASWLGDVGLNHPTRWRLPRANWPPGDGDGNAIPLHTVDLVVQLQTAAPAADPHWSPQHPLHDEILELERLGGAEILRVEALHRMLRSGAVTEHFGFRDGVSQPTHEGDPASRNFVSLGELLLGYANDRGDPASAAPELLRDGTFMVIRKLSQDVAAFEQLLDHEASEDDAVGGLSRETLAAKMMGRYRDGRPIVSPGLAQDENDFDFANDPSGSACPLQAHIRRANPRRGRPPQSSEATRGTPDPRILRRGFSYGPPYTPETADQPRGLFFIAYNASIAEQFEVIQRWISGGNSTGVLSAHDDPLLGAWTGEERVFRFTHEGKVRRVRMRKPLVVLEWGVYLFVPSIAALERLAAGPWPEETPSHAAERGRRMIERLRLLEMFPDRGDAALEWKKLLEDRGARHAAGDVWAAIREDGGVLKTPYGVLVGSAAWTMEVFRDSDTFSVREYWQRMRDSLGELFLGMDPEPCPISPGASAAACELDARYRKHVPPGRKDAEASPANEWISSVSSTDAFDLARPLAGAWLDGVASSAEGRPLISIRSYAFDVIAQLAKIWFGLPDGDFMAIGGRESDDPKKPRCPHDFGATARSIFSPNPTAFVQNEGRVRGRGLLEASRRHVERVLRDGTPPPGSLLELLIETGKPAEEIARTLVGVVHGFVGPTGGSFLSVMSCWIEDGRLWRHQQELRRRERTQHGVGAAELAHAALLDALIRTMQQGPFPYLLHRTPVREVRLGGRRIAAGARVVLGLSSATLDQPGHTEVLFGGDYGRTGAPAHACPGQGMALGAMLGMLSALFGAGDLVREQPLILRLERGPATE